MYEREYEHQCEWKRAEKCDWCEWKICFALRWHHFDDKRFHQTNWLSVILMWNSLLAWFFFSRPHSLHFTQICPTRWIFCACELKCITIISRHIHTRFRRILKLLEQHCRIVIKLMDMKSVHSKRGTFFFLEFALKFSLQSSLVTLQTDTQKAMKQFTKFSFGFSITNSSILSNHNHTLKLTTPHPMVVKG